MNIKELFEEKSKKMILPNLPYSKLALSPIMSKETIELHYNILTKNYFDNFNKLHDEWNRAGAILHSAWWEQFCPPKPGNSPTGAAKEFIEKHHKNWGRFKDSFLKEALALHGNGWIVLSRSGAIKTIHNHKIVNGIVLLIDLWEHAFILDFGADKEKYVNAIWRIIDWDTISKRLAGG